MSRWDRRPAPCLDFLSLWSLEVAYLAGLEVVKLDPDTEGDVGEVGGRRVEEGGAWGGHVPKLAAGIGILTDIRLRWHRYYISNMHFFCFSVLGVFPILPRENEHMKGRYWRGEEEEEQGEQHTTTTANSEIIELLTTLVLQSMIN